MKVKALGAFFGRWIGGFRCVRGVVDPTPAGWWVKRRADRLGFGRYLRSP